MEGGMVKSSWGTLIIDCIFLFSKGAKLGKGGGGGFLLVCDRNQVSVSGTKPRSNFGFQNGTFF